MGRGERRRRNEGEREKEMRERNEKRGGVEKKIRSFVVWGGGGEM